ncbi:hypothetical protein ACRALDRAFT_1079740 [Sodiomyces alcalophilus JCM 7366]|uniref:uncharacterized protein n=1 Tax=Sodiomyces alcalophilus JCM 7366 TaxID=591952 RepID=UPI0039B39BCF
MSRTSLGKRTRDLPDHASHGDSPAKRTRQSLARLREANDENVDPVRTTTQKKSRHDLDEVDNDDNDDNDNDNDDDDDFCIPTPTPRRPGRPRTKIGVSSPVPITPQTPRHRDVFANNPTTPRHVVMSAGKLFRRMTPQTPSSPSAQLTVYHSARQLFARGADPGQLIGREAERQQLVKFAERSSSSSPGGCLYVSGPPGTGKSAMVKEVTQRWLETSETSNVRHVFVNCMSIEHSRDLYHTLLEHVGHGGDRSEAQAVAALQKIFVTSKKDSPIYMVVLDEIDHVLTMGLESLYRLFEWSLEKPSRLMLIGIANALDLTDRFLPRLKSKNLKPELLPFHPYSAAQIKSIITTRLKSLLPEGSQQTTLPFIHPAAIELCSRKVSSQTGDLRKAFEICRRALDLVEAEQREKHETEAREKMLQMTPSRKPLCEATNKSSSSSRGESHRSVAQMVAASLRQLTPETAPRASIAHLNKVTQAAFSNGTNQRLKALNLQQKAALCALAALEKRNRETAARMATAPATPSKSRTLAPTVKMLYDTYSTLCTRDSVLHPLSSSEFREVVGSLEALGLVSPVEGKLGGLMAQTPSKRRRNIAMVTGEEKRLASCVGEKEMGQMTEGVGAGILQSILSGDALD